MWYDTSGQPTSLAAPDSTKDNPAGIGSRWRAWYVDDEGRQRTKKFPTKKIAERWVADQADKVRSGTWIAPEKSAETFATVAEEWYLGKTHKEASTKVGYRTLLDLLVLPRWGEDALKDIKHADIQAWVNELSETGGTYRTHGEGGFSSSRVIQAWQVLDGVLKYAVRTDRITKNAATGVAKPRKPTKHRRRYLTHRELHELAWRTERFEGLTLLLGYCGLRVSEAFALRRRDIVRQRIHVYAAVTTVATVGRVEKDTKTHRSRTIPIPDVVWSKLVLPENPDDLVFPGRKGGHVTNGEYRWAFDKAMAAMGKENHTPHDLRHTCASLAISSGANVKAIQNLLGHATAVMTLDLYGELMDDDLDAVCEAMNQAATAALVA